MVENEPRDLSDDRVPVARRVETKAAKRNREKRGEALFLHVNWGWFVRVCDKAEINHASRLVLLLALQTTLDKRWAPDGWIEPRAVLLKDLRLAGPSYSRIVNQLESRGVIKVRRRAGQRSEVRLTDSPIGKLLKQDGQTRAEFEAALKARIANTEALAAAWNEDEDE